MADALDMVTRPIVAISAKTKSVRRMGLSSLSSAPDHRHAVSSHATQETHARGPPSTSPAGRSGKESVARARTADLRWRRAERPPSRREGGSMRRLRRLLIVLAATAISCILFLSAPAGAVIDGTSDTANKYANVGVLQLNVEGEWFDFCSGRLVRADVVLTAGHG